MAYPHLTPPDAGELVQIGGFGTRYKVLSGATGGSVAIVEHTLQPGLLGAPRHRHSREDEISYVLQGELTVEIEGEITTVPAGGVMVKPRGRFHTFWNAGAESARAFSLSFWSPRLDSQDPPRSPWRALPTLRLEGVDPESAVYLHISRLIMVGIAVFFLVMVRIAWKRNGYDDRVGFREVEDTLLGEPVYQEEVVR
jgi:uncharacterized cupin superfamily protein